MNRAGKLTTTHGRESGFTLVELLIATVIVLVGLVAVAQLVPVSVMMNSNNRNDGTALVFAQHELEALRAQPLSATTFTDPLGVTCYPAGAICGLGDPTQPNQCIGSCDMLLNDAGTPIIDFSAPLVPGYSFPKPYYTDPNDPFGDPYEVRWAVITITNPQQVVTGKRIIVGVFRHGVNTLYLPVTLDTMVEK